MSDTTHDLNEIRRAEDATEAGIPHPYHLVDPSPWPLVGAISAVVLALGGVWYFHYETTWLLILGVLMVLATMALWWRDVIHESVYEKAHSTITKIGMRYGMILFIASEVMFFAAFFWAYFNTGLFPDDERVYARVEYTGGVWPPEGLITFNPLQLPLLMTMILLLSGTTVTWAHHAIREGKQQDAVRALGITVALGVIFLIVQMYEYSHATFGMSDGAYPSAFYMTTGFHGFHVFIGTVFLAVCWWRAAKGHFTPESHFGFEAAAWYWHFVDVVWLFLFGAIYWWGASATFH